MTNDSLATPSLSTYDPPPMVKKLLVALVIFLIVLGAAVGIAVYKLNDIVDGFRPQIERQASTIIGAPVELGEISVSLFPSAELSVAEAKVLSPDRKGTALSLGGLNASVALKPLLSKRIEISNLEISHPKITLIKEATGTRVQGLPSSSPTTAPPPPQSNQPSTTSGQETTPLDITLSRITISDGELSLNDKVSGSTTPIRSIALDAGVTLQGKEITIPKLKLSFSVAKLPPLAFVGSSISFGQDTGKLSIGSFDATSDVGNLHAEGSLDTKSSTGNFSVASKGIDLKKVASLLKGSAPALAAMNASGSISTSLALSLTGSSQPQVRGPITLRDINLDLPSGQKVRGLNGEISLQGTPADLAASSNGLKLSLQDLPLVVATSARVTQTSIAIQNLSVKGLGGETKLAATLQRAGSQAFTAQPTLATISITDLLKVSQPSLAQSITGTITQAKGNFSGSLSGDVARSVAGPGDILVKDFVLKGVNIPNLVLTKVSGIPLLEGTLRSHIAPEHQKYFNDPDTRVSELRADYALNTGIVNLKSLSAKSEAFTLESSGTMSIDGALNLSSTFTLNAEISASMAKRSKTVAAMLTPQKTLAIPVVIQGKSPKLVVLPDISKLMQGAGGKILEQKAGALLEKAFGGKKDQEGKKKPLGGVLGF